MDDDLFNLLSRIRKETDKTIWLWTGLVIEDLNESQFEIFKLCDVVVDGPFVSQLKRLGPYSGSTNQRVINVKSTLSNGMNIVLYHS
jgi:anaerobic ribonucleoside-triphosphate reductase activating protein